MRKMFKMLCLAVCVSSLFAMTGQAATPAVYNNVSVQLAGVREDGIVSANIFGSFGSKWVEINVNDSCGKPMLAVLLTAIATEKPVTIYASQDAVDVNVFKIHWMNIEK